MALAGCASSRATSRAQSEDSSSSRDTKPTAQPILYHRTGGVAGTSDRVVIWPDGFVEVHGKLLADSAASLPKDRLDNLVAMFADWEKLKDEYPTTAADAYNITI